MLDMVLFVCNNTHNLTNVGTDMKSSELIKLLEADGWKVVRHDGTSHVILKKEGVNDLISLSHPRRDVSRFQLSKAKRISGLNF